MVTFHYLLYTEGTLIQMGHPYVYGSTKIHTKPVTPSLPIHYWQILLKYSFCSEVTVQQDSKSHFSVPSTRSNLHQTPKPKHCSNKMQNIYPV